MDAIVQAVLAEYEQHFERESQLMATLSWADIGARLDEFLLPVGPDTGKLMHSLVIGAKSQVIVEIGASCGYSSTFIFMNSGSTASLSSVRIRGGGIRSDTDRVGLANVRTRVGRRVARSLATAACLD
jgi:predicted O-methyltransferase YrrM